MRGYGIWFMIVFIRLPPVTLLHSEPLPEHMPIYYLLDWLELNLSQLWLKCKQYNSLTLLRKYIWLCRLQNGHF